ncbi:MAG: hypothetical protein WC867_07965 [Candidatus Pacearchaeota archaeon]
MLFGLLLGNIIDLDHIYYRIIGKAPWFGSACEEFGMQCSFNFYPLHNSTMAVVFLIFTALLLIEDKRIKFFGWFALGALLNLIIDYIHLKTGFGI